VYSKYCCSTNTPDAFSICTRRLYSGEIANFNNFNTEGVFLDELVLKSYDFCPMLYSQSPDQLILIPPLMVFLDLRFQQQQLKLGGLCFRYLFVYF
jgi:hypothetical protein